MSDAGPQRRGPWPVAPALAPIAAAADEVAGAFSRAGALGVVLVDAARLDVLERRHGHEAHGRALVAIGEEIGAACRELWGLSVTLARGELGRGEVIALMPAEGARGELFGQALPALERAIAERLARLGARIGYPYLRRLPPLAVGQAYTLRNPLLAERTQLRDAVEAARADAELNQRLLARSRRRELMEILVHGTVHSVYEPIVDAHALTVFGYEALVRGPAGSHLAAPLELFEVAADEDLLFALDCLCRTAALAGAVGFPQGAKLFLNIRPSSFHDPSFQPDALIRTLERCALGPRDVVFEISEQESIDNYEIFREVRDGYGKLGFQFALDDTGAGYASLEAVAELAPEFIKVDRGFVRGIDEDPVRQTILRALQTLASDLGARIVGEGLDTLEELRTLGSLGIPFGQGWLFGKPSPLCGDP
ncbi:MAG: EAL domain-containing protein [Deltaproteobacteria bacterium]|nr:EAL domain-containing protein [Deltaproteobacteria bacterium]